MSVATALMATDKAIDVESAVTATFLTPILFRFALDCRSGRVLQFEPVRRAGPLL
jgi:hypothetical protein